MILFVFLFPAALEGFFLGLIELLVVIAAAVIIHRGLTFYIVSCKGLSLRIIFLRNTIHNSHFLFFYFLLPSASAIFCESNSKDYSVRVCGIKDVIAQTIRNGFTVVGFYISQYMGMMTYYAVCS